MLPANQFNNNINIRVTGDFFDIRDNWQGRIQSMHLFRMPCQHLFDTDRCPHPFRNERFMIFQDKNHASTDGSCAQKPNIDFFFQNKDPFNRPDQARPAVLLLR